MKAMIEAATITVTIIAAISLLGIISNFGGTIFAQDSSSLNSFMDCYSKNAANFMLANMFMPFTIDLTDPKMKNLISDMCTFYHKKTGKWVDLVTDSNIMQPYNQEFWNQYPIHELPPDLLEFWKGESLYSK